MGTYGDQRGRWVRIEMLLPLLCNQDSLATGQVTCSSDSQWRIPARRSCPVQFVHYNGIHLLWHMHLISICIVSETLSVVLPTICTLPYLENTCACVTRRKRRSGRGLLSARFFELASCLTLSLVLSSLPEMDRSMPYSAKVVLVAILTLLLSQRVQGWRTWLVVTTNRSHCVAPSTYVSECSVQNLWIWNATRGAGDAGMGIYWVSK